MQDCLSLGKPLLIENVEEELDPVLDPVLDRRIIKKGKSMTIALADKEASHFSWLCHSPGAGKGGGHLCVCENALLCVYDL